MNFEAQFVNVNVKSGYFARSLNVFGLVGQSCKRCETRIKREKLMGRSSHFCLRFQRKE